MANEPESPGDLRRRFIRLHLGESVPADDLEIGLSELRPTTATIWIRAPREIPIGEVRSAETQPGEASE